MSHILIFIFFFLDFVAEITENKVSKVTLYQFVRLLCQGPLHYEHKSKKLHLRVKMCGGVYFFVNSVFTKMKK